MENKYLVSSYNCNNEIKVVFRYFIKGSELSLLDITIQPLLPSEVPLILEIFDKKVSWSYLEENRVQIHCGFSIERTKDFEKKFIKRLAEIEVEYRHAFDMSSQLDTMRKKGWVVFKSEKRFDAMKPLPTGSIEATIRETDKGSSQLRVVVKIFPKSFKEAERIAEFLVKVGFKLYARYPVLTAEKSVDDMFNCQVPEYLERTWKAVGGEIWMQQ